MGKTSLWLVCYSFLAVGLTVFTYPLLVDSAMFAAPKFTPRGSLGFATLSPASQKIVVISPGSGDVSLSVRPISPKARSVAGLSDSQVVKVAFLCSAKNSGDIKSISLLIDGQEKSEQRVNGTRAYAIFSKSLESGSYDWFCGACDDDVFVISEQRTIKVLERQ